MNYKGDGRALKKTRTYRFAELFCGPGGLSLGAIKSAVTDQHGTVHNVDPVWANDIDEDTCKTYARNIHDGTFKNVICKPVEEINFRELPSIDALAFGFPCNDFSLVGEQLGFNGKYGPLYTYGVKAIEAHNPIFFIAENVSGLSSANNGAAFKRILHDFENAGKGYELTANLYKFEDYGVPQTRHRIVIVGIRKDFGLRFKVPTPVTKGMHITAKEVIEKVPIPKDASNHEPTNQSPTVIKRLTYIPPGGNAWSPAVPKELRLNVKGAKLSQIYKRLHPDKPSYTITGSGGGGTHVYHWKEPRALTNRERARIQTFPDSFVFEGSKESVRKQIGMAVPPLAAKQIVEAVLMTLAGIDYLSVPANIEHKISIEDLIAVASK